MKTKIRVILAEKHTLIRRSISILLKGYDMFQVVGEVSEMNDLIDLLQRVETDAILLDLQMVTKPEHEKSIEMLRTLSPKVKIIQWNMNPDANRGYDFINNGAAIYLTSDCDESVLINTIQSHHTVETYSDSIPRYISSGNSQKKNNLSFADDDLEMSERQVQIMKQICLGKNNQQIAEALFLTPSNVDSHKTKIYRKTKCNNAVHLLRYAIKKGIIRL